jgi:hypothetical protein
VDLPRILVDAVVLRYAGLAAVVSSLGEVRDTLVSDDQAGYDDSAVAVVDPKGARGDRARDRRHRRSSLSSTGTPQRDTRTIEQ